MKQCKCGICELCLLKNYKYVTKILNNAIALRDAKLKEEQKAKLENERLDRRALMLLYRDGIK